MLLFFLNAYLEAFSLLVPKTEKNQKIKIHAGKLFKNIL